MLELLAPAGSPEGVVAAVQSGADAIYLGLGDFNARRNAKNFMENEFSAAAEYCRVRGVKTYVTLNTLITDREFQPAIDLAKKAQRLGADALIIQDFGLLRALRQALPEMPIHASTQISVHDSEGVRVAAAMGAERVILARELSKSDLKDICASSPIDIEIFAHGALCMCYSGQCYMSAIIGRRSGNRGLCAQPCRLPYSAGAKSSEYPLSLKDNSLVRRLKEIEECGVKCIKIEGRMRSPEYTAVVTSIFSRVLREGTQPTAEELLALETAFSRQGFTDGYFRGKKGPHMLGIREEQDGNAVRRLYSSAKKYYLNNEFQRVPVLFAGIVLEGEPARLAVCDDRENTAAAEGAIPEIAFHRELTQTSFQTQLYKTGGTPFICTGVKSTIDPGLSLAAAEINEMRRSVLSELMEKRKKLPVRSEAPYVKAEEVPNRTEPPYLTLSVMKPSQLSPALAELTPRVLYYPLSEILSAEKALKPFLENREISVCVSLPRVLYDCDKKNTAELLRHARRLGIKEVLAGNIGHIAFAMNEGFEVRGDFGLNVYNSQTLRICRDMKLRSATLSFEARFEQIRSISKCMDTELIVYGRLPLMVTENCIINNSTGVCSCAGFSGIIDRNGFTFPVIKEYGCRNVILNSKKLFLADKPEDYISAGLWGVRLMFTTENSLECAAVAERYLGRSDHTPNGFTRGLYYRGVE
jgi:putative protease